MTVHSFAGVTLDRPIVMGIVNVTPDSFSDGGQFSGADDAVGFGRHLHAQGARIIDVGGESTRPGAKPVGAAEEIARVVPLIAALRTQTELPISIDTMKPAVARAAILAGADIWNDVTALGFDSRSLQTAAELGCDVVLMHMRGDPRTMQAAPHYDDVVSEVRDVLAGRAEAAMAAGVKPARIWLDPGIGFGKTLAHNLALTARLGEITSLGFPVLLGASRKSSISAIDPAAKTPDARLGGSLAFALAAACAGAAAVRVHDVRETVQALKVWDAIEGGR